VPQLNFAGRGDALGNHHRNRRAVVDDDDLRRGLILAQARIEGRLQRSALLSKNGNGDVDATVERYRLRSSIHWVSFNTLE
jgi:hypothetical protein